MEEEKDCSYDYVEIYDGSTNEATRLGRFCGEKVISVSRLSGVCNRRKAVRRKFETVADN